jgi:drug/metabolite transporter (DMT)-like permease
MLFLVIICSSFGFAMQPVAQKYTTSERTAVLGALNPMGAAVLGMIFLHETMGLWGIAGAGLIAAGLLFQNAQKQQSLGN